MLKFLKQLFKPKDKQRTFCYCLNCRNELISSDSFIGEEDFYVFVAKCRQCGEKTKWLFDAPVPIWIED